MYELFEQKYMECEKSLFLIAIGIEAVLSERSSKIIEDAGYVPVESVN